MTRLKRKRAMAATTRLVLALMVLVAPLWVLGNRQYPEAVSQEAWHRIATTSRDGRLSPYPKIHRVVVKPLDAPPQQILSSYLGVSGVAQVQGEYIPGSGEIHIVGDVARFEATLPPILQGNFRHVLRHEYGHAFLEDWCSAEGIDPVDPVFVNLAVHDTEIDPAEFPGKLRPVIDAYLDANEGIYGMPYFTSTFEEFFAESYARYLEGRPLPARVTTFFDAGFRPDPAPAAASR